MQLFIDSADPQEIKQAWEWGIMDGVTTNPSLVAKQGRDYAQVVKDILSIIDADASLSLEVIATDYAGMIEQATKLAALDDRIVVKLPCTTNGIKACRHLSSKGVLVNITLVFSPAQALVAAKAGAFYISPFVGRVNDVDEGAGFTLMEKIISTLNNYEFTSQVLYSSVRNVDYIEHAGKIGAHIITAPFSVLQEMFNHPLTHTGLEKFLEDWNNSGLELPGQ